MRLSGRECPEGEKTRQPVSRAIWRNLVSTKQFFKGSKELIKDMQVPKEPGIEADLCCLLPGIDVPR